MDWQAMWDLIWAERNWLFPTLVVVVIAAIGGVFALVRNSPSLDIDSVVQRLAENAKQLGAAEQRNEDYRSTIGDKEGTIRELRAAVESLEKQRRQPDAPPGIDEALAQLEQGETSAAESIFREILNAKKAEGRDAHREAAAAARHLGALYFLHDTQKAVSAYEEAVALDPDNPVGLNRLGLLKWRLGQPDEAVHLYERAQRLGEVSEDKAVIAAAIGNLGVIYMERGNLEKAEEYQLKALALHKKLGRKGGIADSYGNLGGIYWTQGDREKAEDHLLKSLALNEKLGRKDGIADNYSNLGLIYMTRGDLEKAEKYHLKSLSLNEKLGREERVASEYGNLGVIYRQQGDLEKAEEYFKKSLALHEKPGNKEGIANQFTNLGLVYWTRGDLEKAEDYLLKSLALNEKLGRKEGMAKQYGNLGQLSHSQGDKVTACEQWTKARRLFAEVGIPEEVTRVKEWMAAAGCPTEEDAGTENLCD